MSKLGNVDTLDLSRCEGIADVSKLGNLHTLDLSGCYIVATLFRFNDLVDALQKLHRRSYNVQILIANNYLIGVSIPMKTADGYNPIQIIDSSWRHEKIEKENDDKEMDLILISKSQIHPPEEHSHKESGHTNHSHQLCDSTYSSHHHADHTEPSFDHSFLVKVISGSIMYKGNW